MTWTDPTSAVAGNTVTASYFNTNAIENLKALRWQYIRKTAAETVTSSTALQDDDHLLIPIAANETWAFEMVLFYGSAGSAGDFKIAFTVPASATGAWGATGPVIGLTSVDTASMWSRSYASFGDSNTISFGTAPGTFDLTAIVKGLCVNSSTAGNITLRWAQNTSDGSGCTIRVNSYALAHRLS